MRRNSLALVFMVLLILSFFSAAHAAPVVYYIWTTGDTAPSISSETNYTTAGDLTVGDTAVGAVDVAGGKTLTVTTLTYLGNAASGAGTANVTGAGSTWTASGTTNVGFQGRGEVNLTGGGTWTTAAGKLNYIGSSSGSSGTVDIDGAGSIWTDSGTTVVGSFGTGVVNLTNGGEWTTTANVNGSTYIGLSSGSSGTVTVDGAGSTWTTSGPGYTRVGSSGTGVVNLTNGGMWTSLVRTYIGLDSAGSGTVNIDGAGSTWTASGDTRVGNDGTGVVKLTNGGLMVAESTLSIGGNNSFIDMSSGGILMIGGDATDLSGFLALIGGSGIIRYWDGSDWSNITNADASSYSVEAITSGDFAGYTMLTVPEPATMSLLALGGIALLRRRRNRG